MKSSIIFLKKYEKPKIIYITYNLYYMLEEQIPKFF